MNPSPSNVLQRLSTSKVHGIDLSHVRVLRLDLLDSTAPGNKSFKLLPYLDRASREGIETLVSFGGPWSNHLHALAAVGKEGGIRTVGIVRGEQPADPSATLKELVEWGMELHYVSRADYRRRNEPEYLDGWRQRLGRCLVIPEGGAGLLGARGAGDMARLVPTAGGLRLVLGVGTGTTLAGIASRLPPACRVSGISALKGAVDLDQRIAKLLQEIAPGPHAQWEIHHQFHCGGFARVSEGLRAFQLEFERVQGIPLEPVYTAKAMYALHQQLAAGRWDPEEDILFVHTGGLQGRRGFSWLS